MSVGTEYADAARAAYFAASIGAFAFLIVLEGGGRVIQPVPRRWLHVGRNLCMLAAVIVLVDVIALGLGLGVGSMLFDSRGLLTPLALPAWAQFAIGFVAVDLASYLFHRASHRFPWLWRLHAVHHGDPAVDASTAVRFHPFDALLQTLVAVAVLVALGIPLWVEGARAALYNPLAMFQHANVPFSHRVDSVLSWLVVTPRLHRVHHSPARVETDSNFGTVLSLWDRAFGTLRAPRPDGAPVGLVELSDARWQTVGGMLLTPWRAGELRRGRPQGPASC